MCSVEELSCKDIINVSDGSRLGFVDDVEIDLDDGRVKSLIVFGKRRFFGLMGREDDLIIPWESIQKIGEDIILVCCEPTCRPPCRPGPKGGFFGFFSR